METLAVAGLIFAILVVIYYSFKPQPLPFIPHNSDLSWFSGDIPYITRVRQETGKFTKSFDMMAKKYGPISQMVIGPGNSWVSRWFGIGAVMVIVNDSQEIYDILVNRAIEFDRAKVTTNVFYATVPNGLVAMPTNSMFKHHKRWLGLSMTSPYLARMVPRMATSIMEMIELWSLCSERLRKESSKERAFSAMDDIRLASIDVIASITFGTSFNSIRTAIDFLESEPHLSPSNRPPTPTLAHSLEQLLATIGKNAFFPVQALLTWWTKTFDTEWNHAHKHIQQFLGDKLDNARQAYVMSGHNEKKPQARLADNVLDMMLEKEREEQLKGEATLSRSEIIDELATYALGGSETTATTIQWGVKILARHPEVQHKLHKELVAKLPPPSQQVATFEEISSTTRLPYLSAVAYELLRVSSTASAVTRDTTCDTTIFGYPIPKGTQIFFPTAYTQHYESASHQTVAEALDPVRSETSRKNGRKYGYWADEDCAEFKPERWLTADGAFNPNAGPWMPFSFGFRGCFGQKLAVLELRMFLAMIHATFFLDKIPEEFDNMNTKEMVTTHPTICYIRPIPWSEFQFEL